MPGAEWFPGRAAELRRARSAPRAARCHRAAASLGAPAAHAHALGRARRQGAHPRHAAAQARREAGRSRRRVPAEHSRGADRHARHHEHRRHLVELRSGLRHARRARPLLAARAEGAVLRGRLPVRRQAVRSQAGGREDHRAAAHARARDLHAVSGSRGSRAALAAHRAVGRPARASAGAGERIPVRAGAVR